MPPATADKPTPVPSKAASFDDLAQLLADKHMPVAEVLALVPELALARAWSGGDVEFGRLRHCVTGRPGVSASSPTLIVESEIDWSGPKTPRHGRLTAVLADSRRIPNCEKYKKYVKQVSLGRDEQGVEKFRTVTDEEIADGQEFRYTTAEIKRDEAESLLTMQVRLTDKGLAALQA